MRHFSVDRSKTFFYNDFLKDYFETNKLDHLRSCKPDLSEIPDTIHNKKSFSNEKRLQLVSSLSSQYSQAGIDINNSIVGKQVKLLVKKNTFTITTGQQIHIGLGPLYVIYKILDVLGISKELSARHKEYNFVPVFWMASEDHDLEEIQNVNVFGKEFTWETNQSGAVGRMNTAGITDLFLDIQEEFRFTESQSEFIEVCKKAYGSQQTLSSAFREIVHYYFKDEGLVILDGDDLGIKNSFMPVMQDELFHKNAEALRTGTANLESGGHKRQLLVRECNVFRLSEGAREKIVGNPIQQVLIAEDALQLSPNAALRPLYQEWVLPNLLYVGGGAEVRYWMQLKGLFDNYNMPMPIVSLRSSYIIIPKKNADHIIDLELMFNSEVEIGTRLNEDLDKKMKRINDSFHQVISSLDKYSELVSAELPGFSLAGKVTKITPKLQELETLTKSRLSKDVDQNNALNKVLKLKRKYFDSQDIQERKDHVIEHIHVLNKLKVSKEDQFSQIDYPYLQVVFD